MTEKARNVFAETKRGRNLPQVELIPNGRGLAEMHEFLFAQLGDADPRVLVADKIRLDAHNAGEPQPENAYNPRFVDFIKGIKEARDGVFRCAALDTEREHGGTGKFKGSLYITAGVGEDLEIESPRKMLHVLAKEKLGGSPNLLWVLAEPHEGQLPEQYARWVKYLCDDVLDHGGIMIRENVEEPRSEKDAFQAEMPYNRGPWANRRITFAGKDLQLFKKPEKVKKPEMTPAQVKFMADRLGDDPQLLEALLEALLKRPDLLDRLFEGMGARLMQDALADPATVQQLATALAGPIAEASDPLLA